jgi:hypothetical protein
LSLLKINDNICYSYKICMTWMMIWKWCDWIGRSTRDSYIEYALQRSYTLMMFFFKKTRYICLGHDNFFFYILYNNVYVNTSIWKINYPIILICESHWIPIGCYATPGWRLSPLCRQQSLCQEIVMVGDIGEDVT